MKKILINASNLHNGGGVQVATSFIVELSRLIGCLKQYEFTVFVSTLVDSNLSASGIDRNVFKAYSILDVHGLEAINPRIGRMLKGFDLVFTVFGPFYCLIKPRIHVVGFAQPWIIYPDNDVSTALGTSQRLLTRFKFFLQWLFFKREDRLVVELQHVKDRLASVRSFQSGLIDVVSNCVSSVYFDASRWAPVNKMQRSSSSEIRLGFVTRDYPHKNVGILLEVALLLNATSKLKYRFFVTLSDAEWAARSEEFRANIVNVGPISVAQCPSFYKEVDGVIFPSLLECFSATPLEAMVMKKPLFASDRGFVRDCCGDNAIYFDPLDARNIAERIDGWFSSTSDDVKAARVETAYSHVLSMPNSVDRAERYLDIICRQLS